MDRKDILKELNNLADKKWAQDKTHINVINSKKVILGVRTIDMKQLAKKIAKTDLEGANLALKDEYYEEIWLRGLLIGQIKDKDECYERLIKFLPLIDSWSICDQTCACLVVFKKDKENKYFEKFLNLSKHKKEFYARVGIVMLMTFYLKKECLDEIFDCLKNLSNHEYYVDMAAAWLVSFAMVKYPESTLEFIKSQQLQKRVQNKAICKCRDSFRVSKNIKEELVNYRIK